MAWSKAKLATISSISIFLIISLVFWGLNQSSQPAQMTASFDQTTARPVQATPAAVTSGQYTAYESGLLANDYARHIIFFHAGWCPECRAFESAILSGDIPSNVQILKADYDQQTSLKQKYGVTLQSTFVEVDSGGKLLAKWVGYGQDKSFAAVDNGLSESL